MLVVDASYAVRECAAGTGFANFDDEELVAPPLMWSETRSVLHEAMWRGEASRDSAERALLRLHEAPVRPRNPGRLGTVSWRLADELGWAKTYDTEYLALAELLRCRVVTVDSRLRRGADRLGLVILPTEL
ncbi:MAG: type II toxin-antitoxin system VapC family toxin [Thermoleophilaceae bacterium]